MGEEDDGGFSQHDRPQTHTPSRISYHGPSSDSGYSPDSPQTFSVGVTTRSNSVSDPNKTQFPGFAYVSEKDIQNSFTNFGMVTPQKSRQREYDSDTGYKSETEVVRLNRQRVLSQQQCQDKRGYESEREPSHRTRGSKDGYSSDVEGYRERCKNFSYKNTGIHPLHPDQKSGSLPYELNSQDQNEMSQGHSNSHIMKSEESYSSHNLNTAGNWNHMDNFNQSHMQDTSCVPDEGYRAYPTPSPHADRKYPPPSPGQFHRYKMLDQSSPINANSPQSFNAGGSTGSRSRSNSASGSHDNSDRFSDSKGSDASRQEFNSQLHARPINVSHMKI